MTDSRRSYMDHVARDFVVVSPDRYSALGQLRFVAPDLSAQSEQRAAHSQLVNELQYALYRYCHCTPFRLDADQSAAATDQGLADELSRANDTQDQWDREWQIRGILPTGQIVAGQGEQTRLLWPGEYVTDDGPGIPPRVGAVIHLFSPRESRTMQAGFYFAFGGVGTLGGTRWLRFYWNVEPHGAARLTSAVTSILNRFDVPFRLKCLSNKSLYHRTDATVIFVPKKFFAIAIPLMMDVHATLDSLVRSETSPLVKRMAAGLGLADEPETGESFGMHRARVLAEGLWEGFVGQATSDDERRQALERRFTHYGLDSVRPYLNAGARDVYDSQFTAVAE